MFELLERRIPRRDGCIEVGVLSVISVKVSVIARERVLVKHALHVAIGIEEWIDAVVLV